MARTDWRSIERQIIDTLGPTGILSAYGEMGVVFPSGSTPRPNGVVECFGAFRSADDPDNSPSAYVDTKTGRYGDSGSGEREIKLWDFAARRCPDRFADWRAARAHFATVAGVELPAAAARSASRNGLAGGGGKRGRKRSADKHGDANLTTSREPGGAAPRETREPREPRENWRTALRFQDWTPANLRHLSHWCRKKPGITPESVIANGGRFAEYKCDRPNPAGTAGSSDEFYPPLHRVIAVPIFGEQTDEACPSCLSTDESNTIGWVIWESHGHPFPRSNGGSAKMLTVGSGSGVVGRAGLELIRAARDSRSTSKPLTRIWKVEGPSDLLALYSYLIADDRHHGRDPSESREHLEPVLSFAGGSTSVPPTGSPLLNPFADVPTIVIGDADTAGEAGALKSCRAFAALPNLLGDGAVYRVRLPYDVQPSKGPDLRDYLSGRGPGDADRTAADGSGHSGYAGGRSITDLDGLREEVERAGPWVDDGSAIVEPVDGCDGDGDSDDSATPASENGKSEGQATPTTTNIPFSNAKYSSFDDDCEPATMAEVVSDLFARTEGPPYRVSDALFAPDKGRGVSWLTTPSATIGWVQSRLGLVEWRRGIGYVTKDEFHSELTRTATPYEAVETVPHVPPRPNTYYTWQPDPTDGTALDDLLSRFNPSTDLDRDLLKAYMATMIWGGAGGQRPAFTITSNAGRGVGKTTVVKIISHVFGGLLDFNPSEEVPQIKTRLLSAEGLGCRMALFDNVKSHNFSWGELEALITAPVISGRRLFHGEGRRPNTITWAITLNGASMSKDLAQRCVFIYIDRPTRSGTWEEETTAFAVTNRDRIISDLVGYFKIEPAPLAKLSRWAAWESAVLSRLPDPDATQSLIESRQHVADVEHDEAGTIQDHFRDQLIDLNFVVDEQNIFIKSSIAAQWFSEAVGERKSPTAVTRIVNQMHGEGTLPRLQVSKCNTYGRGLIWIGINDPASPVRYELEAQIEMRRLQKLKDEASARRQARDF